MGEQWVEERAVGGLEEDGLGRGWYGEVEIGDVGGSEERDKIGSPAS